MNLTLREKCAQMIVPDYRFETPDYEQAIALAKEGVGGFCFFGGTIFDLAPIVNSLQRHAKHPLLIAADYENGVGQQVSGATFLPSNMAVGATDSAELARWKGRVTATEAAALGVRWVLAPVLDLNVQPLNPVINTRSFGSDPALVSKLGRAFLEGLHEKGVIGCGKHFPGHGDATVDSHLELPTVGSVQTQPYAELAKDLDSVMTGHLLAPALDPQMPASLSKAITEGKLRKELGFGGLICTDALNMGAVKGSFPDAVVAAAIAGADCILLPLDPMKAIAALEEAVKGGRLPEERVTQSAERILAVKKRIGLFENRKVDAGAVEKFVGIEEHRTAARKIAEESITLVKGDCVVPENAYYVPVVDVDSVHGDYSVFEKHLATGVGRMIIGIYYRPRASSGRAELPEHLVQRVTASLKQDPEAILVSFGSPYVLRHFPEAKHYVCAWSECEASQICAAWAVQGKIPFRGKMPVELGG